MRPINARTFMIAAVSAAVLAGTVVPANAAELTDPATPTEVAVTAADPAKDEAADEAPAADEADDDETQQQEDDAVGAAADKGKDGETK